MYKIDFSHCFFLLILFKFYMQKLYFEYSFLSHQTHNLAPAFHMTSQQPHCTAPGSHLYRYTSRCTTKSSFFIFSAPANKWTLEANTKWIDFQLILDNLSILKILPTDKSNKQLSTLRKQFLFTFDISGQRYNTIKCTKH